ncbi:MAG: SRPBCC family protein [Acidimicrobiales bacterium]
MELTNEFEVGVPVEQAWSVLTDLERIAPCLPGATLEAIDGDEYRGVVKVKVGPITAQYKGSATFAERDDVSHRAIVRASGRDTRGQGNASATITAQLHPAGDRTRVTIATDLTITGKVAQFGRGALAEVSEKLLAQFVENLESTVLTELAEAPAVPSADDPAGSPVGSGGSAAAPASAPASEPSGSRPLTPAQPISQGGSEPIDLLATAGVPVVKRVLPLLGVAAAALVAVGVVRRRRRRAGGA